MKKFYVYDARRLVRTIDAKTLDDADDIFTNDIDDSSLERDCVSRRLTIIFTKTSCFAISDHMMTDDEHDDIFH